MNASDEEIYTFTGNPVDAPKAFTDRHFYVVGDRVWLHIGGEDNPLVEGKIIHGFVHEGYPLYVVELETYLGPVYEARCDATLSPDAKGPIGMWRRRDRS